MTITQNVQRLLAELPPGVTLLAAAKGRTPAEIREAAAAGITVFGENYVQEAEAAIRAVGNGVRWHGIGHLQKNKVKKAAAMFDMIETVDSLALGEEIDRRCGETGKIMPVLLEINSGREAQKSGVLPENAAALAKALAGLKNLRVAGLMTMGPAGGDETKTAACFRETRRLYEELQRLAMPGVTLRCLSMGMTDSYRAAVREGATIVRIGSGIFGERP